MSAAERIDDEAAMADLDTRLAENAPELRALLKETREGQEILKIVLEAREILAQRARSTTTSVATVGDRSRSIAPHRIAIERAEDLRSAAGEVRVLLNGHLVWSCPFARMTAGAAEAEDGGRLYAQTLHDAIAEGQKS